MTQSDDWAERFTMRVASEIERRRTTSPSGKLSAQWLSDRTSELGHRVGRSRISDLETGRRKRMDVTELLVIARALGVPPVVLLYPGLPGEDVEVLPGVTTSSFAAAQWFSGEGPFQYYLATPDSGAELDRKAGTHYDGQDLEDWHERGAALRLAREEAERWSMLAHTESRERMFVEDLRRDPGDDTTRELIELMQQKIEEIRAQIRDVRRRQRDAGMTPVPTGKRWADE